MIENQTYICCILTVNLSCGSGDPNYCNEQVTFSRMYNKKPLPQKWPFLIIFYKNFPSSYSLVFTWSLKFLDFPSLQNYFLFYTHFTLHSSN